MDKAVYKIVLPTDFSEASWNSLATLSKWLESSEVEFHLLHAYKPLMPNSRFMGKTAHSEVEYLSDRQAKSKLKSWIADFIKEVDNPLHHFSLHVSFNTLKSAVESLSTEIESDLIVVGSRGRTAYQHTLLGSNTNSLIRSNFNSPIISIPSNVKGENSKKIKLLIHPHGLLSNKSIRTIMNFAVRVGSIIDVLCLNLDEAFIEELKKIKFEVSMNFHKVCTLKEALDLLSDSDNYNILAFKSFQGRILDKLTRDSSIKELMMHLSAPLFVMTNPIPSFDEQTQEKEALLEL